MYHRSDRQLTDKSVLLVERLVIAEKSGWPVANLTRSGANTDDTTAR